jgi:DNA-directed RNA polymerase specialized sigma24 family protein
MSATLLPASRDPRAADLLRAAFRDVHGPRLHGFALLLTLGDRDRAGAAAGRALGAGTARADELRHPERAAAWLRARVMGEVRRQRGQLPQRVDERDATLSELHVLREAIDALGQLPIDERAALIAGAIERLDITDVATVLGQNLGSTRRILRAARAHYLEAAGHALRERPVTELPPGAISRHVDEAAAWALGRPRAATPS